MKLQYDETRSSFGFKFNVRRYTVAYRTINGIWSVFIALLLVSRCRLTPDCPQADPRLTPRVYRALFQRLEADMINRSQIML